MSTTEEELRAGQESKARPNPYPVNKKTFKVEDLYDANEEMHVNTYEFRALNALNLNLLLTKEKETKRITETMTKNRSRDRFSGDDANNNFFNGIVIQGWHKIYGEKEVDELSFQDCLDLTIERKIAANNRYLECNAKVKKIEGAGKLDFMFERDGWMFVELQIGDSEAPTFNPLLKFRRPKQSKRSKFREDFGYSVTKRGGDMPIVENFIDITQGIRINDEYFDSVVMDDPLHSQVVFLKEDGTLDHEYNGSDEDRIAFLQSLNPHFKVELAGGLVAAFSKSRQADS